VTKLILGNHLSECKKETSHIAVLYSGIHVFENQLSGMPFQLKFATIFPSTSIYILGKCLIFRYDKFRCGRTEYVGTMHSHRPITDVQTFSTNLEQLQNSRC